MQSVPLACKVVSRKQTAVASDYRAALTREQPPRDTAVIELL